MRSSYFETTDDRRQTTETEAPSLVVRGRSSVHNAIAQRRLHSQFITRPTFEKPADVVRWFGAVQAQDYYGALWAAGLRTRNATQADVEQAIADRAIVRTWPMRGTLHFVAPEDARWMVKLTGLPRGTGRTQWLLSTFGLDEAEFSRSRDALVKAMQGGKVLPRNSVYKVLEAAGVSAAKQRGLHIVGHLARQGLVCFGPHQGKQPTFVLLDEWVPQAKNLERDEALAELSKRYFTSHGPATIHDFAWWSGLTVRDVRAGVEMAKSQLAYEIIGGKTYWFASSSTPPAQKSPSAHLLPRYDEYTVAYRDRSAIFDPTYTIEARGGVLNQVVVVNGQVIGTWKRTNLKESALITLQTVKALSVDEQQAITEAAQRFGRFVNMPVHLS